MSLFPSWLIFSIFAGLASNAFNFISRYLLKNDEDATAYAWFFEIVRFIVFTVIALFDWKLIITPYSLVIFLLLGLTEWVGVYWYMKMHEHSHLSISTILSRMRLIWVPILAFFLLHENLKFSEYVGIVILFIGLGIIMSPKKLFVDKGAVYANLASFIIAFNIVLTKMALPFGSNSVINIAIVLLPTLLFPLTMKNALNRIILIVKNRLLLKLFALCFNIISVYLFIFALRVGDSGKVTAVYQGMLIVSVLAGIIFLKERQDIGRKLIGATITIVGVVLLSFS